MTGAARRYAEALLDSVWNEEQGVRDATSNDLRRLSAATDEVFDLKNALENPSYSSPERLRVLDAIAGNLQLSERVQRFVRLVVERGRAVDIQEISKTFEQLLNERSGKVQAMVTTPQRLDEGSANRIREALERRTGKQVELSLSIDPSLIGGVRAQVGNTVYDGSIRAELDRLKERLTES